MKNSDPKKSFDWQSFLLYSTLMTGGVIVLAAIALPNLLGQVGCACHPPEHEGKNTLGAVLRAQQSVFAETGRFATTVMGFSESSRLILDFLSKVSYSCIV